MSYELWLTDDLGNRIDLLNDDIELFEWTKIVNGIGRIHVHLKGDYDQSLLNMDYRIHLWYSPTPKANLRLENIYFIRRWRVETDADGLNKIFVFASGPNELLTRRIVAFYAGSSQASKTDLVDDMMKEIISENFLTGAGDPRDWSENNFSIEPDASLGPSITKSFSRRNVLVVLQDLSETSRIAGNQIYFAVVPLSVNAFEFRTYINQIGQDRRYPSGNVPVVFSLYRGNVQFPSLEEDFEEEANYVYAGGQGEGAERIIATVYDTDRINESIWNRREAFRDARHEATYAGVLSEARERLAKGRPKRRFDADLISSEGARYGVDWDFGDQVTVEYLNQRFDGMIKIVRGYIDDEGRETIHGKVEVEDVAQ